MHSPISTTTRVDPGSGRPLELFAGGGPSVDLTGRGIGYVLTVVSVWFFAGLLTAAFLGQRGHDVRPLVALGLAFGPLMIPYARSVIRDTHPGPYLEIRPAGVVPASTEIVVLVTGPAEEAADLLDLVRRIGGLEPRLALAVEAPLEAVPPAPGQVEPWLRRLTDAALLFEEFHPRLLALRGRPERSLAVLARTEPLSTVIVSRRTRRTRGIGATLDGPLVVSMERRR